jgi:hypothetical protein
MFTSHETYVACHKRLHDAFQSGHADDITRDNRDLVDHYLNNRLIWEELNHYKVQGRFLGKHPLFKKQQRIEQIRNMKIGELVRLRINLAQNQARAKRLLAKEVNHEQTQLRRQKVAELQQEIDEVNRILNF